MVASPVQYCWMYPTERYLRKLKSMVQNKASPKGCMTEGYDIEKSLTFITCYFGTAHTKWNQLSRNEEPPQVNYAMLYVFKDLGLAGGGKIVHVIANKDLDQMQLYVSKIAQN